MAVLKADVVNNVFFEKFYRIKLHVGQFMKRSIRIRWRPLTIILIASYIAPGIQQASVVGENHIIDCSFIVTLPEGQFLIIVQFEAELFINEDTHMHVGIKSTTNPIFISSTPIENAGVTGPVLLISDNDAIDFNYDQKASTIKNPLGKGTGIKIYDFD